MTAYPARCTTLVGLAAALLLVGCSADPTPDDAPAIEANPLAECAPITDQQISQTIHAETLTAHPSPPSCVWNAKTAEGATDVTFTFSPNDSLLQLWHQAVQNGYQTEHVVVTREALGTTITAYGFYIRDPHNPGFCAVSAAANGAITWRVQNVSQALQPEPCAAALQLAALTIDLSP